MRTAKSRFVASLSGSVTNDFSSLSAQKKMLEIINENERRNLCWLSVNEHSSRLPRTISIRTGKIYVYSFYKSWSLIVIKIILEVELNCLTYDCCIETYFFIGCGVQSSRSRYIIGNYGIRKWLSHGCVTTKKTNMLYDFTHKYFKGNQQAIIDFYLK